MSNVRSWHGTDMLTGLKVRRERGADARICSNTLRASQHIGVFVNQEKVRLAM